MQITLANYQQFQTLDGDRIGWTCEDPWCPIQYTAVVGRTTRFYNSGALNSATFPQLYNNYLFDATGVASVWSAAVEIQGNRKLNALRCPHRRYSNVFEFRVMQYITLTLCCSVCP